MEHDVCSQCGTIIDAGDPSGLCARCGSAREGAAVEQPDERKQADEEVKPEPKR